MKNINKEFKTQFNEINMSNKSKRDIKLSILNKYNYVNKIKKVAFLSIIFILSLSTCLCITYAKEIKKTINTLFIKDNYYKEREVNEIYTLGLKEINQNANIISSNKVINATGGIGPSDEENEYSMYEINDLEKQLNIKILKNKQFIKNKYIVWFSEKNTDNKYTSLGFKMFDCLEDFPKIIKKDGNSVIYEKVDENIPNVFFQIYINTQFFDINSNKSKYIDLTYKENSEEYYIKKLDTNGILVKLDTNHYSLIFDYDNINYRLIVKANENYNIDNLIENILNDFYL